MIKLSGILRCKTQEESDLVQRLLAEHTRLTHQESGCIAFEVTLTADPLVWQVEELFSSKQTFAAHQTRTQNAVWGIETRAIIREYEISEVDPEVDPAA